MPEGILGPETPNLGAVRGRLTEIYNSAIVTVDGSTWKIRPEVVLTVPKRLA